MIPGNKFAFEIFTGDNVVTFGQLESGRRLQVAFLLYHRDIDVKGLADVSLSYDSDICLFTYGLVNCRLLWSGHKALAVDSLSKSCYNCVMHPYFGPTYTVDQAPSTF
jgi:hypothetical protein